MAKVQQKSEKISAFGGIFFVLDRFDRRSRGRFRPHDPLTNHEVSALTFFLRIIEWMRANY